MEKKFKRYFIFGLVFASLLVAGFFVGINGRGSGSDLERSGIDPERVERSQDKLDNVGKIIERAEGEIDEAGREIKGSLTVAGEVGSGLDTIEKGIRACKDGITNIEGRYNRIEQIILEAKARKDNLDDSGD
ncbi:hypothetical protein E4O05_01320 [Treponema sp. OMZ 787]|uniref:hypothetical protein n=1 Tax=Treponema sp. OMZ 787 TaxID=2563669 RepID=UPI0020A2BCD8|nr:hypothetical protein [Treponema sp. OMZ 787]UTC62583.1 hypothetical protein E4O05_01320 [Treponema sp. OMZ 787]